MLAWLHPDDRRLYLAKRVLEYEGNLTRVAFRTGYHRQHIYRLIRKYELWPLVNEIRTRRIEIERRIKRERDKVIEADAIQDE